MTSSRADEVQKVDVTAGKQPSSAYFASWLLTRFFCCSWLVAYITTVALLPPELWDHVLSLLPATDLQSTALSLTRALPVAHISHALLWRFLHLTREGQSLQAIRKLRELLGLAEAVRSVAVEVWRDDPQLILNFLLLPPKLTSLHLSVGPLWSVEQLEELLEAPRWINQLEGLWLRFNPYMTQRSYYTFLKGTYFDAIPSLLASSPLWSSSSIKRLAFCQDLLPNHGVERKETPAFGLQEVSDALDEIAGSARSTPAEMQQERETRVSRRGNDDKMSFAQPIVFHRLHCVTVLSLSPLGANLTSLHLRLPRRSVLTALTAYAAPPSPFAPQPAPFPSLKLLDLSTTLVPAGDAKLPLMLRLMPRLEHLVLDRCNGLVGSREIGEETAKATLRWLGKVLAGVPSSRAEESIRAWRRISKERPTFVAAPGPDGPGSGAPPPPATEKKKRAGRSGYATAPRPVRPTTMAPSAPPATWAQQQLQAPMLMIRDIQIFPPTPTLLSLSMGLFPLPAEIHRMWSNEFEAGLRDSLEKTALKMEEYLHRWEVWEREGKLEIPVSGAEGGGEGRRWARKMVGFKQEVERIRQEAGLPVVDESAHTGGAPGEEDEVYLRFLKSRDLVVISPPTGHLLLSHFKSLLASPLQSTPSSSAPSPLLSPTATFSLCLTPDCSSSPGIAHLSLAAGQTNAVKESLEDREAREKGFAEQEARERKDWRRPRGEHVEGCGHLWSRSEWHEDS